MPTLTHLTYPIRSTKLSMTVEIAAEVASVQTPFQRIDIYDTPVFGRILTLDGHIQLAELDEAAYHEALVHIPLLSVPEARRALVIGGGDGGVLRELCRHEGLERIDMVEIDELVVETCRKHLPGLNAGAFDDPRVHVTIADAFEYVKQIEDPYDFIVLDVTDTYEDESGELSESLFTDAFHKEVRSALAPKGIAVSQADNHVFCPYSLEEALATFGRIWPKTGYYQALVPSFGGYSAYAWASSEGSASPTWVASELELKYLSPTTWALAFEKLPFDKPDR